MKQKMVIGISGKMGTGKSTLTKALTLALGDRKVEKVSMAAPMYKAQDLLYEEYGLKLEGDKDRDLLIAIGLWGRNRNPDFWLEQAAKMMIESDADVIICDDVRFENEADFFNKVGFLVRIDGEQRGNNVDPKRSNDPTECSLDDYNFKYRLSNRQSPQDMCKEVARFMVGYTQVEVGEGDEK